MSFRFFTQKFVGYFIFWYPEQIHVSGEQVVDWKYVLYVNPTICSSIPMSPSSTEKKRLKWIYLLLRNMFPFWNNLTNLPKNNSISKFWFLDISISDASEFCSLGVASTLVKYPAPTKKMFGFNYLSGQI